MKRCLALVAVCCLSACATHSTAPIKQIVRAIQRADYRGERVALQKLHDDLAPFEHTDAAISSRVDYWRGFALWRRAINGFNETPVPPDVEQDLNAAINEFNEAIARDPRFADAKLGAVSCLGYLLYLHRNEPAKVTAYASAAGPLLHEVQETDPDNPRLFWVMGPILWSRPVDRGGGSAKAIENYEKGLSALKRHRDEGPLDPTWGEAELLMNLSWSYFHQERPDLQTAERYASAALAIVPDWHYVRDILLPQIQAGEQKTH